MGLRFEAQSQDFCSGDDILESCYTWPRMSNHESFDHLHLVMLSSQFLVRLKTRFC